MSTARSLITRAYAAIGVGSEILPLSDDFLDEGLLQLQTMLDYFENTDVVLEDDNNTIAAPSALDDEVDEPVGSRTYLVYYLASMLIPHSRVNAGKITIPPQPYSEGKLKKQYGKHIIPDKIPSRLLPRGQGSERNRINSTFFRGEALSKDAD